MAWHISRANPCAAAALKTISSAIHPPSDSVQASADRSKVQDHLAE
jgi:hypothetical protein